MKGSWTLVASVLALSTAALTSTTYADREVTFIPCINKGKPTNSLALVGKKDEYSPRFDGLKFIETLVTAHRTCLLYSLSEDWNGFVYAARALGFPITFLGTVAVSMVRGIKPPLDAFKLESFSGGVPFSKHRHKPNQRIVCDIRLQDTFAI